MCYILYILYVDTGGQGSGSEVGKTALFNNTLFSKAQAQEAGLHTHLVEQSLGERERAHLAPSAGDARANLYTERV